MDTRIGAADGVSNSLKETAWRYFSKYIRIRDALKTTGTITHSRCITCDRVQRIEDMDAGHAVSGRANGILFSEDLCHAQCRICNRFNSGELDKYREILISWFGREKWDKLEAQKHATVKYTAADYKDIARVYREKTKELNKKGC